MPCKSYALSFRRSSFVARATCTGSRGHGISRVETDETGWNWPLHLHCRQWREVCGHHLGPKCGWELCALQRKYQQISTVFSRVFFSSKDGWRGCRFLLILQGLAVVCRYTAVLCCFPLRSGQVLVPLKRGFAFLKNLKEKEALSPLPARNCKTIWVCLKIGYIPNYSHLIGTMIINH